MDEHDPEFDPSYPLPQQSWLSFFADLGKLALLVLAVGLVLAGLK